MLGFISGRMAELWVFAKLKATAAIVYHKIFNIMITGYSSQFDSLIHLRSLSLKVDIYQKQECKGHLLFLFGLEQMG
jgi:hypothetical protein